MRVRKPKPAPEPIDTFWRNITRGLMGDGQLNPIDPRSPNHPIHDKNWLALARVLARLDARKDYETIHGEAPDDRSKIKARNPRSTQ